MKILAIETSTETASVALLEGERIGERSVAGRPGHSETLLPEILGLLADAGVALADLDAIAYGAGPGAFTGLRLACGVVQGLAMGANKPAIPVGTLEALASQCADESGAIFIAVDARMSEVYFAAYERRDGALIISVAVHLAMVGLGLLIFGPEGSRTQPFSDAQFELGSLMVGGHTLVVLGASVVLIVGLYLFFDRTLYGKALRATAINRNGARLMGISPALAGRLTFFLAAVIGVLSGLLVAPITTIYYDSGFLIGLKGFVAAIIGGLASYPLAAGGAILVGLLESFSSFWASAFKDVIVFTLIIPVLMWRSLTSHHVEEEE